MAAAIFSRIKELVKRDKNQPEYFLALNIDHNQIEACIWGIVENQTRILGVGFKEYEGIGNLLFAAGEAIDKAAETTPVDVDKTIFGLPDDWIDQEQVNEPYAHVLKNLAKDLALEPIAFVATSKAVVHFLSQTEMAPINALVIGLTKQLITIMLADSGRISASKIIGKPTSVADSVNEIVKAIDSLRPGKVLPSRIVLYGGVDIEEIRDALNAYSWPVAADGVGYSGGTTGPVGFLHPPKIEVLERGTLGKAVAVVGAIDLGFSKPESLSPYPLEPAPKKEGDFQESDFGFVKGRDIANEQKVAQLEQAEAGMAPSLPSLPFRLEWIIGKISSFWQAIILNLTTRPPLIVVPLAAFMIIFLIFTLYWILPKAKVTLYVNTQSLTQEAEILASPSVGDIDEQRGQIPAKVIESVQSGSQKAVVSGKKMVGDKARGMVTIFNKTTASKNFSTGTVLTDQNSGLKFTLDSAVTVASRSATPIPGGETITYGKAQVQVTAQDIGSDGNLPAGSEFTVADFDKSLYSASNDQAFTGGSSREVAVVVEDDLKKLEDSLKAILLSKAKEDLNSQLPQGYKLLEQAIAQNVISKNFDKKVGEEAGVLTLNMEIKFKATVYSEDDLRKVLTGYLKDKIPADFQLVDSTIATEANVTRVTENNDLVFKAKLKANLAPAFSVEQIRKNLVGKKLDVVEDYLAGLPEVVGSKVELTPPLPAPLATMPRLARRIELVVVPQ